LAPIKCPCQFEKQKGRGKEKKKKKTTLRWLVAALEDIDDDSAGIKRAAVVVACAVAADTGSPGTSLVLLYFDFQR